VLTLRCVLRPRVWFVRAAVAETEQAEVQGSSRTSHTPAALDAGSTH
jgi:hypothetical protein